MRTMAKYRYDRIGEELKREIADIVKNEIKDPGMGFVSITLVEVAGDMRHAKVFYSVLGGEGERKATEASIKRAAGFIRREVASRLSLRYTPELTFIFDDSIEHGIKIAKILNEQIKQGENGSDEQSDSEEK